MESNSRNVAIINEMSDQSNPRLNISLGRFQVMTIGGGGGGGGGGRQMERSAIKSKSSLNANEIGRAT